MAYYALQVISGNEQQVSDQLKTYRINTILPYNPRIIKSSSKINLAYQLLIPGYVIANLTLPRDYFTLNRKEFAHKVVRICGNGYEAVPLQPEEIDFLSGCSTYLSFPIHLEKIKQQTGQAFHTHYEVIHSPPYFQVAVDWFEYDKFKARLRITQSGFLKDHCFTTAAYADDYQGVYLSQLQGFQRIGSGQFDPHYSKAI